MSTFNLNSRVKLVNPVPNVDSDYGVYNSILEAETAIPLILRKGGKTVGIWQAGKVVEYWWEDDGGTNLVVKNSGGTAVNSFFIHTQNTPATTWSITHNLGRNANVVITDNAGVEYEAQIRHNSINQITIIFNTALSGTATLT